MTILGGLDIHRGQVTFDYVDTATGEVSAGKIREPHRERFREWLAGLATSDACRSRPGCRADATTPWRACSRISEALNLCIEEVTREGLVVRNTKFGKSRLLPLHETTRERLDNYLERRHRELPQPQV